MKVANKINGEVMIFPKGIPNKHPLKPKVLFYKGRPAEEHYADGYREWQDAVYDIATQKLGEKFLDETIDKYTNHVLDKTVEEIQAYQDQLAEQETLNTRATRNELLKVGVIVPNNGVNYWFNEKFLNNFITATQVTEKAGGTHVTWEADDKSWNNIPVAEAFTIGLIGMQMIQSIYVNN